MRKLDVRNIAIVGVAKGVDRNAGREQLYQYGEKTLGLSERDPILYFIQRIRDEAHRFAIGSHRHRRSKDIYTSPLDEIEGIGLIRKRALLAKFGSAKAISMASRDDLRLVQGISEAMANAIYNHFRG